MKRISILLFCSFFLNTLSAQKNAFTLKSSSDFYESKKGETIRVKLVLLNNFDEAIQIMNAGQVNEDSDTFYTKQPPDVYYKVKKKYKYFGCRYDESSLARPQTIYFSGKKINIVMPILSDCTPAKGDYKIRLHVVYKLKGSKDYETETVYSNWFYFRVN